MIGVSQAIFIRRVGDATGASSTTPYPMPQSVRIIAPSRIHFGLLSVHSAQERQYGGAGAMLAEPKLELTVRPSRVSSFCGKHASRAASFAAQWQKATGISVSVDCQIISAPPEHIGLGLGTQLGMSIAWALDSLSGRDDVHLHSRAASVGRGKRSAVGTYGFRDGGLIVEDGKKSTDSLGRLHAQIQTPPEWRVLITRLPGACGLANEAEALAFADLPNVPPSLTLKLRNELYDRLAPAARDGDFATFSESIFQYGYAAGECFSGCQGGPFLTASIANFVEFCRDCGVAGVGQSSWGPSVFCWFPNQQSADEFIVKHLANYTNMSEEILVTGVASEGARRVFEES